MRLAPRPVRPTRVLMLGGGYVTLHAYRGLVARTRAGEVEIVVVSADDCHNFHGFTGEVVGGALPLEVTRTPLVELLPRARVIHGVVEHVDLDRRRVAVRAGDQRLELEYDHLVVGTGSREPTVDVPGLTEFGHSLRSPGDLARLVAAASDLGRTGDQPQVLVAGGGVAGVELASALAERGRRLPAAVQVTLVHSGAQVAAELRRDQPALARRIDAELSRAGVAVRTDARVTRVLPGQVELSDGSRLPADLVLAVVGERAVVLPGLDALPRDRRGKLHTSRYLKVAPGIWSAGDAAHVVHPRTGEPVPANALWAIKGGAHLGRNLAAVVGRRKLTPFGYRGLGRAAAFGNGRAIAELYGVPFTGGVAWLLRLVFFLRFMPTTGKAVDVVRSLAWRS